ARLGERGVELLDQRKLPGELIYETYDSGEGVARAIEDMVVRGAPASGVAAAMGSAVELRRTPDAELRAALARSCERLAATRPTAVNLAWALGRMRRDLEPAIAAGRPAAEIRTRADALARAIHDEDLATCRAIGDAGARLVPESA